MAQSPDGRTLYPLLEGTVTGDPAGDVSTGCSCVSLDAYRADVGQSWPLPTWRRRWAGTPAVTN
ncbi:hypothetical protein ACLQ28_18120 [Micromonospora sp. DT201]|uniref:hypothetical protein n=1 Tax=Micromonospora sp. DT201 TaxID=3393442 RepID=UPI003CF1EEE0